MYFALPHLTLFRCLTFKKEDRDRLLRPFQLLTIFCALVFVCICFIFAAVFIGIPTSNPLTLSPCLTFNKEDRDRLPLPIFPETRVLFPNFCQLSTPSHPIKPFWICQCDLYLSLLYSFIWAECFSLKFYQPSSSSLFNPIKSSNILWFFFIFGIFICVAMFSVNISSPHLIMTLFKLSKSTFNSSLWQLVEKFGNLIE